MKQRLVVCYFGVYNPKYIRNWVLINGLRKNKVQVFECSCRLPGLKKYWHLFREHWKIRNDYNVMVVGFSGQLMTIFAKFLTRKPIVFDALVPLHDAIVFNHQVCRPNSFKAKYYYFLDWLSLRLADLIICDTIESINYYSRTFKIDKEKCQRIFTGANNEVFRPLAKKKKGDNFIVGFYAIVYKNHGIEYIVKAAEILQSKYPEIVFRMIGASRMYQQAKEMAGHLNLKNMKFFGFQALKKLPYFIAEADVCLGLFGQTNKTQRVIPNKAFEVLACQKPLINADTPAMNEIFTNKKDCLLCQTANTQSLAEAILILKNDRNLRNQIAENGFKLFQERLTPEILGRQFKKILNDLL